MAREYCGFHYSAAKKRGELGGPVCSGEGCDLPVLARSFCQKHYEAERLLEAASRAWVCMEPDCPAGQWRLGFCGEHQPVAGGRKGDPCTIEACDLPILCRGVCAIHYSRHRAREDFFAHPATRTPGDLKRCGRCGLTKDRSEFQLKEAARDKRATSCDQCHHERRIVRNYGASPGRARQLAARTTCAVCGDSHTSGKRLHVDHCHGTGLARDTLCNACNTALGHARDDPDRLRGLAAYVEQWRLIHQAMTEE